MMNMHTADNNKPTGLKLPAMSDLRNDLMESIRKVVLLKKVDTSVVQQKTELPTEIRGGIELRLGSVDTLKRAIEILRKLATQGDSPSSNTVNSDENESTDDN